MSTVLIFWGVFIAFFVVGSLLPKHWVFVWLCLGVGLVFVACGESPKSLNATSPSTSGRCEDSSVVGVWQFKGDVVGFGADCKYFSQGCNVTGTYEPVLDRRGSVRIKYETSDGLADNCYPAPATYVCTYERGDGYLDLSCPPLDEQQ